MERFGRFTRILKPGLNLIVPMVDRIGAKLSMMEEVLIIPSQDVITRDNAMVTADAIAFYQVVDAAKAAYEVNDLRSPASPISALTNALHRDRRHGSGRRCLSKRDEINERLLRVVDTATSPWGIKVTRIEIKDLSPPADITQAMNRQMKAERERRAAVLRSRWREAGRDPARRRSEAIRDPAIGGAQRSLPSAMPKRARRSAEAEAKATRRRLHGHRGRECRPR